MFEDYEKVFEGLGGVDDGYIEIVLKCCWRNKEIEEDCFDVLLLWCVNLLCGDVWLIVVCFFYDGWEW